MAEPNHSENLFPCTSQKGRNLVICIDGTGQKYKPYKNTNVVELYRRLIKDKNQLTYYSSGIGTYAKDVRQKPIPYLQHTIHKMVERAVARDFEKNVWSAYRWLVDCYEEGDRIFLFGYSRGAYQIRVLAAMIKTVGLLQKGNKKQIPYAYEVYVTGDSKSATNFKEIFSRKSVHVHFIGAWDSVSSIKSESLPKVDSTDLACYFRHALALDEYRKKFKPEYVNDPQPRNLPVEGQTVDSARDFSRNQRVKEVWFSGSHCDIGGENMQDDKHIDRKHPAFVWICYESLFAGLVLNAGGIDWTENGLAGQPTKSASYWRLLGTHKRKILPHQTIHISLAFCEKYIPKAHAPKGTLYWVELIGSGGVETTVNPADDKKARRWYSSWISKEDLRKTVEVDIFSPSDAEEQEIVTIIGNSENISESILVGLEEKANGHGAFGHVKNAASYLLQNIWDRDPHIRLRITGAVASFAEPGNFFRILRRGIDKNAKPLVDLLVGLLVSYNQGASRSNPGRKPDLGKSIIKQLLKGDDYARQKLARGIAKRLDHEEHLSVHYVALAALAKNEDICNELLQEKISSKLQIRVSERMPSEMILATLKAIAELAKHDGLFRTLLARSDEIGEMFVTALDSKDKRIRQYSCATIEDWAKHRVSPSSLMTPKIIQGAIANLSSKINAGEEWTNDPVLGVVLEISKNHRLDRYGLNESELIAKWSVMNNPGSKVNTLIMELSKYDLQRRAVLKDKNIENVLNNFCSANKNINQSTYQIIQEWIVHDDSRNIILDAGFTKKLLEFFISECKVSGLWSPTTVGEGSGAETWKCGGLEKVHDFCFSSPTCKIILALLEYQNSLDKMKREINEGMDGPDREIFTGSLVTMREAGEATTRDFALKCIVCLNLEER